MQSSALDLRASLTLADELLVLVTDQWLNAAAHRRGRLVLSGPDQERSAWLSNGFQSWSMSGASTARGPRLLSTKPALEDLGDQE